MTRIVRDHPSGKGDAVFDEKDHWRQRHDDHDGEPRAVGIDLPITRVCSSIAGADLPERGFDHVHSWALGRHSDAAWVRSVASHRIKLFERTA